MYRPLMLLLLSSAFVSIPSTSISQEACDAPYIASDVGLSTGSNLPEDVAAATRAALIGRCFDVRRTPSSSLVFNEFCTIWAIFAQPFPLHR